MNSRIYNSLKGFTFLQMNALKYIYTLFCKCLKISFYDPLSDKIKYISLGRLVSSPLESQIKEKHAFGSACSPFYFLRFCRLASLLFMAI